MRTYRNLTYVKYGSVTEKTQVKSVSRLMIIVSIVACCFASSDVPRQVFGYNAECDQATL